jgi:FixJ family two-component response regulator
VSREPLIAVIDDDEPYRIALVESLVSSGYRALEFSSAEEFVAKGERKSCDCVITDIHMPGMSGFDLARLLMASHSKVPLIMITAREEPGLEGRAAAAGAVCLLKKPFESSALIGCLDRLLSGRQPAP